MATITEAASGFPSSNGHIPHECGTIAEVLGERGWNTYMTGKWHLTPEDEMNLASIKNQWPLGRGFERFYGFLGAETNQWYPDLVYDNHPVEQPTLPEDGYHLTTDLTDHALVVHPGRQGDRSRQAVLPLLLPRRLPRAPPRSQGVGRQVQGQVRHGLRGLPRAGVRAPEEARDPPRAGRALADQSLHRRDAAPTANRAGPSSIPSGPGTRCPTRRSDCSRGWPRCTRASSATPTTRSDGCSTTSSERVSSTTR